MSTQFNTVSKMRNLFPFKSSKKSLFNNIVPNLIEYKLKIVVRLNYKIMLISVNFSHNNNTLIILFLKLFYSTIRIRSLIIFFNFVSF